MRLALLRLFLILERRTLRICRTRVRIGVLSEAVFPSESQESRTAGGNARALVIDAALRELRERGIPESFGGPNERNSAVAGIPPPAKKQKTPFAKLAFELRHFNCNLPS